MRPIAVARHAATSAAYRRYTGRRRSEMMGGRTVTPRRCDRAATAAAVIVAYALASEAGAAAGFARKTVARACPPSPARAKAWLFACSSE
jgi:hypothetical protein